MANRIVGGMGLYEALKAEGFQLPDLCVEVRVVMGVDSALMIQFDCDLDDEKTAQFGRALVRMVEENQA